MRYFRYQKNKLGIQFTFIIIAILSCYVIILNSKIGTIIELEEHVISIEDGYSHSIILTNKGKVYISYASFKNDNNYQQYKEIEQLKDIIQIKSGGSKTVFLSSNNEVWEGNIKNFDNNREISIKKLQIDNIVSLSCGDEHTIALKRDGSVWGWGNNYRNQITNNEKSIIENPVKIDGLKDIVMIDSNAQNNIAIDKQGQVWSWGENYYGQLGIGSNFACPYPVKTILNEKIIKVSCGRSHSLALASNGNVWVWGSNGNGQLGDIENKFSNIPVLVKDLPHIKDIVASDDYNIVIDKSGNAWSWGGDILSRNSEVIAFSSMKPIKIDSIQNITKVFANYDKNYFFTGKESITEYLNNSNYSYLKVNNNQIDSNNVVIALIDSNINVNESQYLYKFVNVNEIPNNLIDDDKNGYIDDLYGWDFSGNSKQLAFNNFKSSHGSYMYYIICKTLQNQKANPDKVSVLPINYTHDSYGNVYDLIRAIKYADSQGADIINCSFGSPIFNVDLYEAIKSSPATFICSAGNGGVDIDDNNIFPACFELENVICVAASDVNGDLLKSSNYGDSVDLIECGVLKSSFFESGKQRDLYGTSIATAITSAKRAVKELKK